MRETRGEEVFAVYGRAVLRQRVPESRLEAAQENVRFVLDGFAAGARARASL
jgi:hypothetical protein